MHDARVRRIASWTMIGMTATVFLAGCVYRKETTTVPAASPATVIVTQPERTVTYPQGRYELRGSGTATAPYYWVWIPAGAMPPNPPPPPPAGR